MRPLNFGALIAFMGVNLSAFVRFYVREQDSRLTNVAPPLFGLGAVVSGAGGANESIILTGDYRGS